MIKKIFLGIPLFFIFLYISIVLSLPKEGLWFKLEELAQKKSIIISNDEVHDKALFLSVSGGEISFQNLSIGEFTNINIFPLFFFNYIEVSNLRTGKDISQFGDYVFKNIKIRHDISAPKKVVFKGFGNFGEIQGRLNIEKREIDVLLHPNERTKKNRQLMKHFKKDNSTGGYLYYGSF
jgi:hypothetical protein